MDFMKVKKYKIDKNHNFNFNWNTNLKFNMKHDFNHTFKKFLLKFFNINKKYYNETDFINKYNDLMKYLL